MSPTRIHLAEPPWPMSRQMEKLWREQGIVVSKRNWEDWRDPDDDMPDEQCPGPWMRDAAFDGPLDTLRDDLRPRPMACVRERFALGDALRQQLRACVRLTVVDTYALEQRQLPALTQLLRLVYAHGNRPEIEIHHCKEPRATDGDIEQPEVRHTLENPFKQRVRKRFRKALKTAREEYDLGPNDPGEVKFHHYWRLPGYLHDRFLRLEYRDCPVADTYFIGPGIRALDASASERHRVDAIARLQDSDWETILATLEGAREQGSLDFPF